MNFNPFIKIKKSENIIFVRIYILVTTLVNLSYSSHVKKINLINVQEANINSNKRKYLIKNSSDNGLILLNLNFLSTQGVECIE